MKHWIISSGEGVKYPILDYLLAQFKRTADGYDTDITGPTLTHIDD